jgi:hypothetical protein
VTHLLKLYILRSTVQTKALVALSVLHLRHPLSRSATRLGHGTSTEALGFIFDPSLSIIAGERTAVGSRRVLGDSSLYGLAPVLE